jgi:hypothetical protein
LDTSRGGLYSQVASELSQLLVPGTPAVTQWDELLYLGYFKNNQQIVMDALLEAMEKNL